MAVNSTGLCDQTLADQIVPTMLCKIEYLHIGQVTKS